MTKYILPLTSYQAVSIHSWMYPSSWFCHIWRSWASLVHVGPIYVVRSSRHLRFCLPLVLLPFLGCHSVTLLVHLLSSLRIRWPAHLHLASLIFTMISFTWVCFLISVFLILSLIVMLSILLSIALCAVISFCSNCLVVVHVSAPYVIVGITHWSNILLLRDIGSLRSQSISLNLPKQLHPAFILIITSSRVWFSIITVKQIWYGQICYQENLDLISFLLLPKFGVKYKNISKDSKATHKPYGYP